MTEAEALRSAKGDVDYSQFIASSEEEEDDDDDGEDVMDQKGKVEHTNPDLGVSFKCGGTCGLCH